MMGRNSVCLFLLSVLLLLLANTSLAFPFLDRRNAQQQQQPLSQHSLRPYATQPTLHFKEEKDDSFKVLIITDTHLLDDQTVPGNATNVSRASTQAVQEYLKMEKPDFVVHLGDMISGEAANSTKDVETAIRQILSPMVQANIPFSTTKGNHDNDKFSTHSSITDIEKRYAGDLSYTRKAPRGVGGGPTGTDNYWVPIYPGKQKGSSSSSSPPSLLLWFFDSRSGKKMLSQGGASIDDWVDASVGKWIQSETEMMKNAWGKVPPSLLFVHIPLHASLVTQTSPPYKDHVGGVANESSSSSPIAPTDRTYPGLNDDLPLSSQGGEGGIVYTGQDRAFIDAFMKSAAGQARVHGIVSGHDHGNDWCAPGNLTTIRNQIVPLCFAKHSGFGGYDHDRWNHGARVFNFNQRTLSSSVETYIRLLTGETRYQTQLNDQWSEQIPS